MSCIPTDDVTPGKTSVEPRQFFRGTMDQQVAEFPRYDFETQYRLYIYGNQKVEPPALHLVRPFARGGARIVEPLRAKLLTASEEATIRDIVLVFAAMDEVGSYDVGADGALMDVTWWRVSSMKEHFWREFCEAKLRALMEKRSRNAVPRGDAGNEGSEGDGDHRH